MSDAAELARLPISLNDVLGLNFMSPIESMDWASDRYVIIKYADSIEMLDLNETPPRNVTIANAEALVSFEYLSKIMILVSIWTSSLNICFIG